MLMVFTWESIKFILAYLDSYFTAHVGELEMTPKNVYISAILCCSFDYVIS